MVNLQLNFTILAGGYTTFLSRFTFLPLANPPSLVETGTFDAGTNPSWIERSPVNAGVLYAVNEVTVGTLLTFTLDREGTPALVQNASSAGNGPAFANTFDDGKTAIALNYGSGDSNFFTVSSNGLHLTPTQNITFTPPPNGVSHPHFFLMHNEELFVVDLGADKVWRLSQDSTGKWAVKGFIAQPKGSGPRRAAIFDDTIYVLHESDNTLTEQQIPCDPSDTNAPILSSVVTTQAGVNSSAASATYAAAELLTPPPALLLPVQYLYASNRDISPTPDPLGDTIAIFALNPLRKVGELHTGLNQIRGMEFGGQNGEYIAAAGVAGNGIAVFERIDGGAGLKLLARNNGTSAQSRSTFVWL